MNILFKILIFFRIVDEHDNNISLTNLGLIIILAKLALVQNASIVDIGALLMALINYNTKKYINKDSAIGKIAASLNPTKEESNES